VDLRQRATSRALILFGDRVRVGELASAPGEVPLPSAPARVSGGLRRRRPRAGVTISGLALSGRT